VNSPRHNSRQSGNGQARMRITSRGQVTIPLAYGKRPDYAGHRSRDRGSTASSPHQARAAQTASGRGTDLVARMRGRGDGTLTTDEIIAITRGRSEARADCIVILRSLSARPVVSRRPKHGNTSSGRPCGRPELPLGLARSLQLGSCRACSAFGRPRDPDNHGGRVRRDERHGRSVAAPRTASCRLGSARCRRTSSTIACREAEVLFRRIGITFAVYGEADAQERLIPFDVLRAFLAAAEWDLLRSGLERTHQGDQSLHPRRLSPAARFQGRRRARDLVFQNPVFRRNEWPEGAARHLCAYRRHRYRAGRSRDVYVLEGQSRDAFGRLLHAGNGRSCCGCSGNCSRATVSLRWRTIPRAAATLEIGGALDLEPPTRWSCCSRPASTTPPITSIRSWPTSSASSWSRAATVFMPRMRSSSCALRSGAQAGRRIYRRIDDDFLDPLAFRRFRARGAGPDVGLPGRQRHAGECRRHRDRRWTRRSTAIFRRS